MKRYSRDPARVHNTFCVKMHGVLRRAQGWPRAWSRISHRRNTQWRPAHFPLTWSLECALRVLVVMGLLEPFGSVHAQNVYGTAQPSQAAPIAPPAFRDDNPTLRNDNQPQPYTNQIYPVQSATPTPDPNAPTVQLNSKSPSVQTEPEAAAEISPTATADSLFHFTPGLRLSEQTDLASVKIIFG